MKYSEQEMASLISEVETQFADYLSKAEAPEQDLQKTEETKVETEDVDIEEEIAELGKAESDVELDYDEEDYVEMDKLYHSMSKAEQGAHYKSLKKSLFNEETIEKKEEVETKIEKKEVTKEEKLEKKEFDVLKEENVELKKNLEKLTAAFTQFIQKQPPKRKAITKIEYIKKSEADVTKEERKVDVNSLSKNEISARLSEKIRSGKLEKSDREAINSFYNDEIPSIDSIKHLL